MDFQNIFPSSALGGYKKAEVETYCIEQARLLEKTQLALAESEAALESVKGELSEFRNIVEEQYVKIVDTSSSLEEEKKRFTSLEEEYFAVKDRFNVLESELSEFKRQTQSSEEITQQAQEHAFKMIKMAQEERKKIHSNAQTSAEELVSSAKEEAELAKEKALQIIERNREEAELIIRQAKEEAERILEKARAETMLMEELATNHAEQLRRETEENLLKSREKLEKAHFNVEEYEKSGNGSLKEYEHKRQLALVALAELRDGINSLLDDTPKAQAQQAQQAGHKPFITQAIQGGGRPQPPVNPVGSKERSGGKYRIGFGKH